MPCDILRGNTGNLRDTSAAVPEQLAPPVLGDVRCAGQLLAALIFNTLYRSTGIPARGFMGCFVDILYTIHGVQHTKTAMLHISLKQEHALVWYIQRTFRAEGL